MSVGRKESIRAMRDLAKKAEKIADDMEHRELHDGALYNAVAPLMELIRKVIDHAR